MKRSKETRVLAVGLDAAESSLVQRLIEDGELPALKRLLERGKWMRVESPAEVGSGAVWPTFVTGMEAREHGIYGEWCWQAETMSLARFSGRSLKPFWKRPIEEGLSVGLLDVPFAPVLGLTSGFQVSEWGAHDTVEGRMDVSPAPLKDFVEKTAPHPFQLAHRDARGLEDGEGLLRVGSACIEGVRLRGELAARLIVETRPALAIITFTEIHRASHQLWHTVAPDHSFYRNNGSQAAHALNLNLRDIYREVDSQVGKLAESVNEDAFVMVFALHGMRPTCGIPNFLEQLLVETGWASLPDWAAQSWKDRALKAFSALKRHAPSPLKNLYYRTMPRKATYHLAQPTMMPSYDWTHTHAFALPTDQHGWIRLNLSGREAKGIVPPEQYEETCHQIKSMLTGLKNEEDRPLVRSVITTAQNYEDALKQRLPDLIVHYDDAVFTPSLKIKGMPFASEPIGRKNTGQHANEGFLLTRGGAELIPSADRIRASDLSKLIVNVLKHTLHAPLT